MPCAVYSLDPCRCPLCGQPNQCEMAAGDSQVRAKPCWCTQAKFSAELLQRVPQVARHKACICQACVQASQVDA